MARIRSIHPALFTDEAFVALSMPARILLIGIWTEADDHGVFEWKPLSLKMRLFPADNVDVPAMLSELVENNLVKQSDRLGFIRNFCKYQRPKKPSYKHALPDDCRDYVGFNGEPKPVSSEPVPHQSSISTEKAPQMEDGEGENEEVEEKKDIRAVAVAPRPRLSIEFEEFQKAYPKRRGGNPWKPAEKLFRAALSQGATSEEIISALRDGVGYDREKIGTEYIPQAQKWLRDQRWKDAAPKTEAVVHEPGVYVRFDSPQMDAWCLYERNGGRKYPRDRNGGWRFPTEWPPGFRPSGDHDPTTHKDS